MLLVDLKFQQLFKEQFDVQNVDILKNDIIK